MKIGSKTHLCDGNRKPGDQPFGRLVNLYVRGDDVLELRGSLDQGRGVRSLPAQEREDG